MELTNELVDFAVHEFNAYPRFIAAMRTKPPYLPEGQVWPPKWVLKPTTDKDGPMVMTRKKFLKNLCILYLLGVKGLATANLDDLFPRDPVLREGWLCNLTNRRDFKRFLRQVCSCMCAF